MNMSDIQVRLYKKEDRDRVREIFLKTAFFGESSEAFFESSITLADFMTLYFTDLEPESSFVAEKDGLVIGYLMGATDVRKLRRIFLLKIFPGLLIKFLFRSEIYNRKNLKFIVECIKSFFKGEFFTPDFSKQYPATLHINVLNEYRDYGAGSRLIEAFVGLLYSKNISGVSLSTNSDRAGKFFLNNGFALLWKQRRSYLRYLLNRDVNFCIYGRKVRP